MADIRVGISGFRYAGWRGEFYPKGLPQRQELEYAARCFRSIELNGSFYSLQRPESFEHWREQTPDDFVFAVKGGRFITHMKKLRDVETPLANFFASGLLCLGPKLGPILWQFPERMPFDERFERFFSLLPQSSDEAAALSRKHDERLEGRSFTRATCSMPLRHAVEIRSESCRSEAFIALLRRHGIALVVADTAGKWPYLEDVTTDFMYVRLHGAEERYTSGYSPAAIGRWARRVRAWSQGSEPEDAVRIGAPARRVAGRDVYVYFDNDAKVKAPFDALALAGELGLDPPAPTRRRPAACATRRRQQGARSAAR